MALRKICLIDEIIDSTSIYFLYHFYNTEFSLIFLRPQIFVDLSTNNKND